MPRPALTAELRDRARNSLYQFVFETDEGKALLHSPQGQELFRFLIGDRGSIVFSRIGEITQYMMSAQQRFDLDLVRFPEGRVPNYLRIVRAEIERLDDGVKHIAHDLEQLSNKFVDIGERFLAGAEDTDPKPLEALAAQGAPVNYHDPRNGATALHYVAAQGARPAFRVLLKTGKCDFLARDHKGRLVSEMAGVHGGDLVMERLLLIKEIRQARQTGVPLNHIYRRDPAIRSTWS